MNLLLFCLLTFGSPILPSGNQEYVQTENRPELVLYYLPYCPYSQKVLQYLKYIHKTIPMKNLQNDPVGREELGRLGGKMQVPCLFIDGHPLYESDDIVEWLSNHQDYLEDS